MPEATFCPGDDPRAGPGFPVFWIDHVWNTDRAQALSVADSVMAAIRRVQSATTGGAVAPISQTPG